ncbi:4092_t:CDS:2, partial [Cetraspora pellucida]
RTSVDSKPGKNGAKHFENKPRRKSTSDVGTQTNLKPTIEESSTICDKEGCLAACKSFFQRCKRLLNILVYLRFALVLTLYTLIFVDVIHLIAKIPKDFWVECLLQVINAGFTIFTLFSHPKRIANFVRAIKIYKASRKWHRQLGDEYPLDIKRAQKRANKDYEWYIFEGDKAFICPPGKLLIILTFWNIGSLAQYGICAVLWSTQQYRPIVIYLILDIVALICEIVPIPLVVVQSKRARLAQRFASFEPGQRRLLSPRY